MTNGEVARKEKETPNGAPASKKLMKIGTEEHEQNGVSAPNIDARIFGITGIFPESDCLIRFGDMKVRRTPIAKIITKSNTMIFMLS